ncbi:peptidoglycan-binding protein [Streptomyces sp. SP18CS02]|uniref:peptidoglycan-binding protein n=1 Tax=Streptomyces sp. SP18CS02 TaxID=3002531 RepID=UPI002E77F848|nr:peptidoglycan-binding protein [Streptomyces sp. SP18CS02]MEE1752360.1 peptidoglycan-binding protein [Streptomyces sp. SP18CS02]
MAVPVFEEYEPAADCPCAGCARQRRELVLGLAVRAGGHPAAHGARRALVLFTAAGVVLGGGAGVATATGLPAGPLRPAGPAGPSGGSDGPDSATPQGGKEPLHGRPHAGPTPGKVTPGTLRQSTRADIINRAKLWLSAKVPYSMEKYWTDGYRQDCSGYVSMAWNLAGNEWTGSLAEFGTRISRTELQPGDILLFHNPDDPTKGSHVTIFGGWTDYTHTHYIAYEQANPHTRKQSTPMAYWNNSAQYLPYRYKGLIGGTPGSPAAKSAYPGRKSFGPGANNSHVSRLGRMLVERGGGRFYRAGPGPRWGEADRRATQAFQRAQGWSGRDADGLPGARTWRLLLDKDGRGIPGVSAPKAPKVSGPKTPKASAAKASGPKASAAKAAAAKVTTAGAEARPYPGPVHFRPGRSSEHVERLGRRLVELGFGAHYRIGPERTWTEADRRNVEAFQRAQGWRGGAANGYPGPETWRRLFR